MDLVHQRIVFYSVGIVTVICIRRKVTHLVVESVKEENTEEEDTEEIDEDSWLKGGIVNIHLV